MDSVESAAFWSYAHEDDRLDNGSIVLLARHLEAEFSLITGRELQLFVDHNIEWGDEWRRRIDTALTETTFFIPVLTPRYFTRPECRREASAFYSNAHRLGVDELLMPILYAPIPEFSKDSGDDLIALMSSHQCTDWTNIRLEGPGSHSYRRAVNALARRLAQVELDVSAKQLRREVENVESQTTSDLGVLEAIESINSLLPEWLDAVESSIVVEAQFNATWALHGPRLAKLERSGRSGGARFALIQRIAKDELPLAENGLKSAQTYSRTSRELDPLVNHAFRILEDYPDTVHLLDEFYTALDQAATQIAREKLSKRNPKRVTAAMWARERAHLSRLVAQLADRWIKKDALAEEANGLVNQWIERRAAIERKNGDAVGDSPSREDEST